MNIGIIGVGNVGGHLGSAMAARGHQVKYGARDRHSDKAKALLAAEPDAQLVSIPEAVAFGEVVVLAVRPDGVRAVAASGAEWSGKIVVDLMNQFVLPPDSAGSLAEDVARLMPGAKVVKAFNTIGAEQYGRPQYGAQAASMFICGDDAGAKARVTQLTESLGFEVVDAGPLSNASLLESLGKLWVYLSRSTYGRDIAFKLLRR